MRQRLRQWLGVKHKVRGPGTRTWPDRHLHEVLGLVCLARRTADFPWANASGLLREPDAGNPPVRFDERGLETEHGTD